MTRSLTQCFWYSDTLFAPIEMVLSVYLLPIPFVEPMLPYFIREKKIFMAAQAPGSRLDLPGDTLTMLGPDPDSYKGLSHADLMRKQNMIPILEGQLRDADKGYTKMDSIKNHDDSWSSTYSDLKLMDENQSGNPFKMGGDEIFSIAHDALQYVSQQ